MNRFNVEMEISLASSQNYDSGKLLIETFGRGKLPRYAQPNYSERNNFERQQVTRCKYSQNRTLSGNIKNTNNFTQKMTAIDKEKDFREPIYKTDKKSNQFQFDQIDEISNKINGIIKSISMSCQKKTIISHTKQTKMDKIKTDQKINHLHRKYSNHDESQKRLTWVGEKFDRNTVALQRHEFREHQVLQQKNIRSEAKSIMQKSVTQKTDFSNNILSPNDQNEQEYEDMSRRIQKINDKILHYQRKKSNYQELYQANTNPNEQYIQESNPIKECKNQKSTTSFINANSFRIQKNKSTTHHPYTHSNEKKGSKCYDKQNIALDKQGKSFYSKKQKYFCERYNECIETHKKSNDNEQQKGKNRKVFSSHELYKQQMHKPVFKKGKQSGYNLSKPNIKNISNKTIFIKNMIQQISLDQDFRYAKHMFAGMQELFDQKSKAQNRKWAKLKDQLKNQGVSLSIKEVKEIFMPRDNQIDPFMSVSHSHEELIHGVIFAYQTAEKHWKDNMCHNWTLSQLKQSNLTSVNLDRGKKGYISLEDLIFYINTEVDGSYRNRDLMLIFKRFGSKTSSITQKHKLKFKQIIDTLLSL